MTQNLATREASPVLPEPLASPVAELARKVTTLQDLPYDVKANIARMCHVADQNIDDIVRDAKRRGGLPAGWNSAFANATSFRKSYPKAIGALYKVSKEWNALAAPFLFEALPLVKASDSLFRLIIAPLRGVHFRTVELTSLATERHLVDLVQAVPHLTALRRIDYLAIPYQKIMSRMLPCVRANIEPTLNEALSGARWITFRGCSFDNMRHLTALSANRLVQLTLTTGKTETLEILPELLALAPYLRKLVLALSGSTVSFQDLISAPWTSQPQLTALSLTSRAMPEGWLDFVALFADHLAHYWLNLSDPAAIGPILPDESLARLETLTVNGVFDVLAECTKSLDAAKLPLLGSMRLVLRGPYKADRLAELLAEVEKKRISRRLVLMQTRGAPVRADSLDAVEDALDFASDWRDRATLSGDQASLDRLAKHLKAIEVERLLHAA